jgi:hypothetical protein
MTARRFIVLVLAVAWAIRPAAARVDVTLDAASLNELLVGMAPDQVQVELMAGRAVNIQLHDMKVTGSTPRRDRTARSSRRCA